jgi:hypothetical protein
MLNAFAALQAGVHGWSWYMLASRDNWYMSPITELGRFRPELAPAFAEIVRVFRELDPPALTKECETAVSFSAAERGAGLDQPGRAVEQALYAADIDYESFDVATGQMSKPLLFYAGGGVVSEGEASRFTAYVEGGGTLVLFQPTFETIGANLPESVTTAASPHRLRLELADHALELSSPSVFVYSSVPGEPILAERVEPLPQGQEGGQLHLRLPVGARLVGGYIQRMSRGRLVVIGVEPTPELMVALHQWLGVRIPSRAATATRGIHSAVFRRAGSEAFFAIVTNMSDEARDAKLVLEFDFPARSARDLRTGATSAVVDGSVTLQVPARSGMVLQLLAN